MSRRELGPYAQDQGHNRVRSQIIPQIVSRYNRYYSCMFNDTSKKEKHNEKVCRAQEVDPRPQSGQKSYFASNCVSAILNSTEANLMKRHRKIKHYEKVCHIQESGSHVQSKGCNEGLEVKSSLCDSLKPSELNFVKPHKKLTIIRRMSHTVFIFQN